MTHWSINRRILAIGSLILLVCLVVSLTPWYQGYTAEDERWGCAKLRMLLETYEDEANDDIDISEMAEERLSRAVSSFYRRSEYGVTTVDGEDDTYTIEGLCPTGGQYTVHIDEKGRYHVSCDVAEHDNDYSDYTNS